VAGGSDDDRRLFASGWHYAGRSELVGEPSTFLSCFAGHVPLVVVRDRECVLRAFVNVCRHRGHLVASGAGRRETLQCPYHAWTYALDGTLLAAPRAEREGGFDPRALSLVPARVAELGPLVLVNPDPGAPDPQARELEAARGLAPSGEETSELPLDWRAAVAAARDDGDWRFVGPATALRLRTEPPSLVVKAWRPLGPERTLVRCDSFAAPS
jgi:phenylpropionate dioxygenase-like ring-hydroxylating dioxygenase large terminal subunit